MIPKKIFYFILFIILVGIFLFVFFLSKKNFAWDASMRKLSSQNSDFSIIDIRYGSDSQQKRSVGNS
jgi:hypothetical protein